MLSKLGRCAVLLVLTACGVDLNVPPTTEIACNTGDDCPDDFICLVTIQRCVRQGGDISLPHVTDVSVSPRLATRGTTVQITITSDIELASAPEVDLTWGGDVPGRAGATPVSSNGTVHVLRYEVGSGEVEGFLTLSARLFSVSGVPNTFDLPRAVELDFTAPQLVPNTARIELGSPAAALRTDVSAATTGSTVTTFFAVNEPLSAGLTVTADTVPFTCTAPLGTFYTCTAVADGVADGAFTLVARMSDLAGNEVARELGTFSVDATPPSAPVNAAQLVLHRTPHGSAETDSAPRLWLEGGAGTVEPGVLVVAWDRESSTNAVEIARMTATADGALPAFVLPGVDRVDVYVQSVDGAGNASARVQVLEGVWTATLGGKEPYDDFANAHRLVEEPYFLAARDVPDSEPAAPTKLATADGDALVTSGGPVFNRGPVHVGNPSPRGGCGLTFDTNRGLGILFGGYWVTYGGSTAVTSNETWSWDGYGWSQLFPDVQPTARGGHALVFDRARGNAVLFGGCTSENCATAFGDTWTFDGSEWTRACWPGCTADECSCSAMPTPRGNSSAFYDAALGEVVLFGGLRGSTVFDETWAWNGTSWRQITLATRPSPRFLAQVATNATTGQTMLQAGRALPSAALTDTWSWQNGTWTQLSASGGPPSQSWELIFDTGTGAFTSLFSPAGQRRTWNGSTWDFTADVPHYPVETGSGAAYNPGEGLACVTYDTVRRNVVRFGGCLNSTTCNIDQSSAVSDGTWVYRNLEYREVNAGYHPTRRSAAGIVAIPGTREVKMFHGQSERMDRDRNGIYSWNGVTWRGAPDTQDTDGTSDMAMAFIDATRIVRYGGDLHAGTTSVPTYVSTDVESWSNWTGDVNYYTQPAAASVYPENQAMVYRSGKGGVFFRGSTGGVTTWLATWAPNHAPWMTHGATSGVLWTPKPSASSPPSTSYHALAACPALPGVLLFGGRNASGYLGETWYWDETWTKRTPVHSPSPRGGHTMFCDTTRNTIFLMGGTNGSSDLDDVWEWDGTDWRDVTPRRRMPARSSAMAAYLPWRSEGVIFGGYSSAYLDDTWIFDGGATASPGHVFSASFSDAAVWDDASLEDVEVRWVAGGVGYNGSTPSNGARLLIWDGGRWRETGTTNDATVAAPASLAWSTATDGEWSGYAPAERATRMRRLFVGNEHGVGFAITPRGTNAQQPGGASIASDYVEVTVRYRLTP